MKEITFEEFNDICHMGFQKPSRSDVEKAFESLKGRRFSTSIENTRLSSYFKKYPDSKLQQKTRSKSWAQISRLKLPISFIKTFKKDLDWILISSSTKLSESFIREFRHNVNWYYISWKQKLSESFIREFQDKVDWEQISDHQSLSESFIIEFQDKVHWRISEHQTINNRLLIRNQILGLKLRK